MDNAKIQDRKLAAKSLDFTSDPFHNALFPLHISIPQCLHNLHNYLTIFLYVLSMLLSLLFMCPWHIPVFSLIFFLHNIIGLRYRSPLDCSRSTYSYTPCSTPWSPNTPTYYIPLSFQFLSCLHSSSHSNSLSLVQSTASSGFFPAVLKPQCSSLALARAFANKWHLCSIVDVEPPRYKLVCL